MARLSANRYGKTRVRVMKVVRHADYHAMKEWNVRVLLHGDFESCFTHGDNSKILPTDTMKNTVYWLARESNAETLEEFALELTGYLVANNPQVEKATAEIEEKSWKQMIVDGAPHATTYQLTGPEAQTTSVTRTRSEEPAISSGVDGLVILKTTHSEFTGYIKDRLTTLPETTDRIFATRATITWEYQASPTSFQGAREAAIAALLATFAQHHSLSVQHTLYDMGAAALEAVPEMARIELTMPNLHCLPVDLGRFGQTNPNMIFVPTDEPSGYIEAIVER
ncbi:MAG TPA: urate oxidase [Acidobacteriaceae bacterium]